MSFFLPSKQCWTEGRSSTAVAEDFRPTATVAEVWGHSYDTVAINDLLCMKNAGAQIAMDFS